MSPLATLVTDKTISALRNKKERYYIRAKWTKQNCKDEQRRLIFTAEPSKHWEWQARQDKVFEAFLKTWIHQLWESERKPTLVLFKGVQGEVRISLKMEATDFTWATDE